jgi:hypothetical protein
MTQLSRKDLWSLEEYAAKRKEFRAQVMQHKKDRQVVIGNHARLYFEDEKTIRYQIQEMLRIEKVYEAEGIQDELDAYNPLIPDGSNWKATLMLEYDDVDERRKKVTELIGIEKKVWVSVQGYDKVYPIADEDLQREDDEKTSTVHFLCFELTVEMINATKKGADISIGIEHENFSCDDVIVSAAVRKSLANDLILN